MKKIFVVFMALMMIAGYEVQAQGRKDINSDSPKTSFSKERLNLWSTDVELNLFGNNFNNFRINELNLRRYLNDQTALRFTIGFGWDNDKAVVYNENEDPNIDRSKSYNISHNNRETINKEMDFKIGFGYEFHRDIFDMVDIYAGGELGFESKMYSATVNTNNDSERQVVSATSYSLTEYTYSETKTYSNSDANGNINTNSFFVAAFAGADVYIYKNVYVGGELGLKYNYANGKNGFYETTSNEVTKTYNGTAKNNITSISTTTISDDYSSKTGVGKNNVTTQAATTTSNTANYYNATTVNKRVANTLGLFIEPSFHIGIRF